MSERRASDDREADQVHRRVSGGQSRLMSQSGCSAVDVPMTSYGVPDEHPMSIRSASDERRWKNRGWKYVAMIVVVLVMSIANIGVAWGADFTPAQIVASGGTTASNIKVSSSYAEVATGKKLCSSQTSVDAVSISNNANANYNTAYVEIQATSGSISTLGLKIRGNADGTGAIVLVFWSGDAQSAFTSYSDSYNYIARNGSDCDGLVNIIVPSNTKTVRIYKSIRVKDGSISGASGYTTVAAGNTLNIFGISATASSGGCTSITPTWSTNYSSTTLNVGATSSIPVVGKGGSSGAVSFSSSDATIASVNASTGVVTGVGAGTATITATVAADGGKCEGTVTKEFTIKAGVTYNANGADGGSVPTDASTYAYNANITVAGNTGSLYKTGFVFNGWNTSSDGTGTHYEAGATMKMPNKSTGVTLYAEWVGYATSWEWWNCGQSNDGTDFTYLTDKNYLCSFKSSGDKAVASWDMSGGVYYRGIKIKTKDHSIAFWVQTGKRVSITFGTRPTKPTFTVGGVDKSSDVGASENADSITVTYTTTGDTKFYIENETATKTAFTVKSVKIEDAAPSCTAPSSVSVDATNTNGWRYSIGETIDLTCTASGGSGGSYTYQWQKYIGSSWEDIDGATNARFQKASCTSSDGGSYRCVVSTGAGCELASSGYQVYVFTLDGNYYGGGDWVKHPIVWNGANTGTVTLSLTESSTFMYKVTNNDGKWYGGTSGNFLVLPAARDHYTDQSADIRLFTGPAGNYTFTIDITHFNDFPGTPYVNISVAYPSVSHPAAGYSYFKKWNDWSGYYVHWWYNDGSDHPLSTWGSDPQVTTETTICGTDYIYFPVLDTYNKLIVKDAVGDASHKTGDLSSVGSSGKYFDFTNENAWNTFTTYTVTTAPSTAGYGTVSAASVSSVACGTSISASTNTLTVGATSVTATATESGAQYTYAFDGWTWTPAGSTVTSDVTATANFTRTLNSYTVTWKNGSTTLETDASVNYGATPSYDGSTPTKDADALYTYTFSGWSPAIGTVTGDAIYSAQFTATPKTVAYGDATIYAYNDSKRVVSGTRKTAMETTMAGSNGETAISGSLPLLHSIDGLTSVVLAGQCKSEVKTSFPWLGSYIKMKTDATTATITFNVASGYAGTATIYFSAYSSDKAATLTNSANSASITSDKKSVETEGNQTSKDIALVSGANTLTISGNNGYISRIDVALEASCTDPGLAYATSSVTRTLCDDLSYKNTLTNSNGVDVTYTSSNTSVATVASDGTLTIKAAGTTTITASSEAQTKSAVSYCADNASYTLTVNASVAAGLSYASTVVSKDANASNFTNALTNSNGLTVSYSSSNTSVATVNASTGEVDVLAVGMTTITATSAQQKKSSTCYSAGEASYTLTVNAVYTVTYNANGGSVTPTSETVSTTTLPTPTHASLTFDGWYKTDGTKVTAPFSPTGDITLYARWSETCSGGGGGGSDPVLGIGVSEVTTSSFLTTYVTEGITISSDQSWVSDKNIDGAVVLESSGTYNTNYLEVLSSEAAISKVSFLLTGNGTDKSLQPVVFGWATSASSASAATYRILEAETVSNKGYTNAEWFTYDFSESNVKCIHIYKNSKNISSADPAYTGSSTALGGSNTIWVYGVKIWLNGSGGSSSACHKVLYHGNGATSGYIYDPAVYDDGDGPTVLGNVEANGVPFVKAGQTFQGWAEGSDHAAAGTVDYTVASIAAGTASITDIDGDVDLYAVWSSCTAPTTAFANGSYTIGGSALDLSTLISSKQGDGTITYAVTDANGTGASIAGGTSFTATIAGTATVTATQAADGGYCEKVMDATISVIDPATPIITWTLAVGSTTWACTPHTEDETNITSVSHSAPSGTIDTGNGTGDRTAKINIDSDVADLLNNPTNYITFTFNVACNKKLTPDSVVMKVANVGSSSGNNETYKAVLSDNYGHSISATLCPSKDGELFKLQIDNEGEVYFQGDVTLKVWAWNTKSDNKATAFRFGNLVKIVGTIEDQATPTATITWTKQPAGGLSGTNETVTAVSSDGSAVTITSNNGSVATVAGSTVSYVGVGSTYLTASGTDACGNTMVSVNSDNFTVIGAYNLSYDANTGTGTMTGETGVHYAVVKDNGFTAPSGKVFFGWNTAANGTGDSYQPGDAIELNANTTLYAQWGTALTATWSVTKVDSKLYRGGGGYSVTVYLDQADWDASGNKDDLELTATEGVTLKNIVKSINGSDKAQVTANFDITTGVDADATSITFTLFVPAAGTYASAELTDDKDLDECSGGSGSTISIFDGTTAIEKTDVDGTSYKEGVEHTDPQTGFKYTCKGVKKDLYTTSMSNSTGNGKTYSAGLRMGGNSSSSDYYIQLKVPTGYTANLYIVSGGGGGGSTLGVSKTAGTSTSYHEYANRTISSSGSYYLDEVTNLAAGTYYILGSSDKLVFGEITVTLIPAAGEGGVATTLSWETDLSTTVEKEVGDADFTHTATQDKNSLGAITYSSNNTAVATVNATTGKVHIVGVAGEATITATLAASGCFEEATATYTINVVDNCIDEPGTITSRDLGCEGTEMTVSGHTGDGAGATYQWYKVGSPDEAISGATSATYTATAAGEYYVIVTNSGTGHCPMASTNTVTVTAKAAATATKIVDSWYVKNGRRTPDVALVQSENAESFTVKSGSTTIWESAGSTKTGFGGCGFHMDENGIIYLNGTTAEDGSGNAPSGLTGDADVTLTITAIGCGGNESKDITIHCQASTTRKSIAFVVDGTKDGAFDADNESHSVNTALYKYLDNTASGGTGAFDLTAQNIYATTDEKAIREHYSQFDAILITDDPGTKETPSGDYKTKGYVNAFGTMVDVRPILTMEAYVSALANWKTKGIAGEPTSPNPRQYALRLECKDHEIYKAGLPNPAPGTHVWDEVIGGETYRNVVLVDHNKSPYTGLADNEETAGNKSPALQGFDGTASGSLLGLGRISNGSLQAAIERQEEPAARLLVFSIQAKALPNALTEEGKIVIKNILTYLLKTNMEEVDDCSNYFTGKFDNDWSKADNWSKTELPSSEAKVRILAECEIGEGTQVHVSQVDIVTGGTSSKLDGGTANGRLTISAGGSLIVGGKIRKAEAPHFGADDLMPMDDPSKLIINTGSTAQAALIFDNDDADTKATVNLYSLGRKQSSYQYQYFAVPMEVVPVNPTFANETHGGTGIYTYVYNEATSGWERRRYYDDLFAFEGLGITTKSTDPMNYTMTGNLASTATKEITLTHDGAGLNLIGNSWMAPIQIGALTEDNAGLDNQTVYIYCAGRDAVKGEATSGVTETAGQWIAIPFEAAEFEEWKATGKLSVIPAMQAFQIKVDAEATLTLDYDKVVRGSTNDLNAKLRAPGRRMAANEVTMTNIRVADSKTHTDLSLFEGDRFSEAFDNGWEAEYMNGDGRSAKLYAETEAGQMAVAAMYDYEGTVVGFVPGQETEYTFSFMGEDNGYYLNDIKLQNSVRISEGETYTFTYEEGDAANRFYISRTAINAPEVPTGMENLDAAAPRVQKIIYNDKLYIIRGGRLYDATGKVVK